MATSFPNPKLSQENEIPSRGRTWPHLNRSQDYQVVSGGFSSIYPDQDQAYGAVIQGMSCPNPNLSHEFEVVPRGRTWPHLNRSQDYEVVSGESLSLTQSQEEGEGMSCPNPFRNLEYEVPSRGASWPIPNRRQEVKVVISPHRSLRRELAIDVDGMHYIDPFIPAPRRRITGQTPPPGISPLRSPPERTPSPKAPREEWSPLRIPKDIPKYNIRKVKTPPHFLLSPFYGHSTPLDNVRNQLKENDQIENPELKLKAPIQDYIGWERIYKPTAEERGVTPILDRQDVDSLMDESLVPFDTPEAVSDRSMEYRVTAKTPVRSPAVALVREEMKRDPGYRKYEKWFNETDLSKAIRGKIVMRLLTDLLRERLRLADSTKLSPYEVIAMLEQYLQQITYKLLNQNLEIGPFSLNNPAMDFIEQKKISIRRIIKAYEKEYTDVQNELYKTRAEAEKLGGANARHFAMKTKMNLKKELEDAMDMTKRKERIIARKGICSANCPFRRLSFVENRQNEKPEKMVDDLRREILELDTACLQAHADINQFMDFASPNLVKNLAQYFRNYAWGVPEEILREAAQDVATHVRRIFKQKRFEWKQVQDEINDLYTKIQKERADCEFYDNCIEMKEREKVMWNLEMKKCKTDIYMLKHRITDAKRVLRFRKEAYKRTYDTLNSLKEETVFLEAQTSQHSQTQSGISQEETEFQTAYQNITSPGPNRHVSSPSEGEAFAPPHASSPVFRPSSPQQRITGTPPPVPISPQQESTETPHVRSSSPHQERVETPVFRPSTPRQEGTSTTPFRSHQQQKTDTPYASEMHQSGSSPAPYSLDDEQSPSGMPNVSDLSESGWATDSQEEVGSTARKRFSIHTPDRKDQQLQIDVEIVPRGIRQSPSGRRVVCDVAVEMQEAASRPQRRIERRNIVVRGTPPISQTVGRRFDRKYGMFTPQSAFKRRHISQRKPLFEGDYESPPSPWGTGRKTHPEFMDMTQHAPSPRPPKLNTTIEWEKNP